MQRRALPLALLFFAVCLAGAALAEDAEAPATIYRWIDQNGVAHYTTDPEYIPEALRDQLPERRAVVNPPLSAEAPESVDAWIGRDRPPEPKPVSSDAAGDPAAASGDRLQAIDARIVELEAAISADEDLLKGQLIDDSAPDSNETLKQVAARMPARIEELSKLRAEREALAPAPAE